MLNPDNLVTEHFEVTRRHFLRLSGVGAAGLSLVPGLAHADESASTDALARAVEALEYFTPPDKFGTVERGTPLPYTHPVEKLREVGMTRATWKLEVVADPDKPANGPPGFAGPHLPQRDRQVLGNPRGDRGDA